MMGMIGFAVGIVGFLLHQFIDLISDTKWSHATAYLQVSANAFLKLLQKTCHPEFILLQGDGQATCKKSVSS